VALEFAKLEEAYAEEQEILEAGELCLNLNAPKTNALLRGIPCPFIDTRHNLQCMVHKHI
jgi:hypothetical protein